MRWDIQKYLKKDIKVENKDKKSKWLLTDISFTDKYYLIKQIIRSMQKFVLDL